jgi:ATPase family AAA domain-containing protein 3A/B
MFVRACVCVCVGVDDAALREAAERTEGFSGRELSKLAIALQAAAYANEDAALTRAAFDAVVAHFIAQHHQRQTWVAVRTPH